MAYRCVDEEICYYLTVTNYVYLELVEGYILKPHVSFDRLRERIVANGKNRIAK